MSGSVFQSLFSTVVCSGNAWNHYPPDKPCSRG